MPSDTYPPHFIRRGSRLRPIHQTIAEIRNSHRSPALLLREMELRTSRPVIISAGIGQWYPKGVERLERSLNFQGWPGDVMTWKDIYPPASPSHDDSPYYFKIAAFEWALYRQYTHIVWVDSSFWAIRNPMPIFDLVNTKGFFMFRSGYNMAQTINDAALTTLGIERDDIEAFPEYASGIVGLNFNNPDARRIYETWKRYMDTGLNKGSRVHDGGSTDIRFLHHRQDQSCLSLAMYKLHLGIEEVDYVSYYGGGYDPSKCIFFINGL